MVALTTPPPLRVPNFRKEQLIIRMFIKRLKTVLQQEIPSSRVPQEVEEILRKPLINNTLLNNISLMRKTCDRTTIIKALINNISTIVQTVKEVIVEEDRRLQKVDKEEITQVLVLQQITIKVGVVNNRINSPEPHISLKMLAIIEGT